MKNDSLNMLPNTKILKFPEFNQDVGRLTPIEACKDIPFEIKRVYYITKVPAGVTRGFHSHRKLEQVLLCLNGSVKIRMKTPYKEKVIELDNSAEGLYIGHMIWREMFDFTPGAVLMVLASEHYTEADYIRDYDQYIKEANQYFEEK